MKTVIIALVTLVSLVSVTASASISTIQATTLDLPSNEQVEAELLDSGTTDVKSDNMVIDSSKIHIISGPDYGDAPLSSRPIFLA